MPDGDFVGGRRPLVPPDVKMEVMLGGRGRWEVLEEPNGAREPIKE